MSNGKPLQILEDDSDVLIVGERQLSMEITNVQIFDRGASSFGACDELNPSQAVCSI